MPIDQSGGTNNKPNFIFIMEQLKAMKGSCLARPLETKASDSTGFQNELLLCIMELDESKMAYDTTFVDFPLTRCYFAASLVTWADAVNKGLLDYLEKISKGEYVDVLNVDYHKFSSQDYWLSGRMKSDMMAYKDIPLNLNVVGRECRSSIELYEAFEDIVCEMALNFNKVKNTFDQLELYAPVIQKMKQQFDNPLIVYEYALMKEGYLEPTLKDYHKMQVKVCMDLLQSGMLNNILSISNEEIEAVDEAQLHMLMDSHYKKPDNLKELWAKLKKFIEVKEKLMIIPRRDLLLKYVLKHKNILTVDHIRAVYRFDKLLKLIHKDMVKIKPELAQYLNKADDTNTFGIVNSLTRLMQQAWFKDYRTDPKYDHAWIEKFVAALLTSEYRQELLTIWQDADKRLTLKGNIIGCLKMAGVIDGSDLGIATALLNGTVRENKTFASYMGLGKKMIYSKDSNYCSWICDHLKD